MVQANRWPRRRLKRRRGPCRYGQLLIWTWLELPLATVPPEPAALTVTEVL